MLEWLYEHDGAASQTQLRNGHEQGKRVRICFPSPPDLGLEFIRFWDELRAQDQLMELNTLLRWQGGSGLHEDLSLSELGWGT